MNKRLLLPLLLLVLSCSQSPNVAGGVETGNGFTTGIVVSSSNSPVVAIVKAVPIKFNPSQDTLDHSLIDTTLDNGEYSITLKAGQYNIIAEDTGGAEIALSKNIEIVQDATTDKDITLAENQPYTYTFTDNIHGEGDLYFEGTTFIQHYSSASRSVEFANLPANTWYPPLHRVENGTNAIVANGVITSTAIKVKKTDGFSEFNVLTYDSTRNILWAGSALNDGIFKFSLKGKKLSQDNYLDVAGFTYGITAIEPASNEQMIIGTGRGLFLYDPSLEDKYIAIDAGNSNVNKPVDLFQKDAIIWSAFSDGVYYGSEVVPIAQTSSMSTRDDSIYVGTAAGELFEFSTDNPVPTKRAITLPSIYDIYALSNGKLLVATNQKLSVVDGTTEEHCFDQFSKASNSKILRIRENRSGEAFILTANDQLYIMTSSSEISQIVWPEELQITLNIKRAVVDFDFDTDENIWLLLNDGALIKIVNGNNSI